jgi:hypothetical protein
MSNHSGDRLHPVADECDPLADMYAYLAGDPR